MAEEGLLLVDSDRVALAVVRSLGRAGFRVALATAEDGLAESSRHAQVSIRLPDPLAGSPAGFTARVRAEIERRSPDFLFAAGDGILAALAPAQAELARLTRLVMPSAAAISLLIDRRAILAHAAGLGIGMPRAWVVEELEQARDLAVKVSFPLMVRPARRVVWGAGGRGARERGLVARDRDGFRRACAEILALGPAVAEAPEAGRRIILDLLWAPGAPPIACQVGVLAGRSGLRFEPAHGVVMAVDPELMARARALAASFGTSPGLFTFEFITRDGNIVLADVRPGPSPALALEIAAGVDFPRLAVEVTRGRLARGPAAEPACQIGLRMRHLRLELAARRERGWRGCWRLIPDWLHGAGRGLLGRERLEVEALDDLGPAGAEIRRFGALVGETIVGAWHRGRELLTHAASGAPRRTEARQVLVLCDGNICRSPFLEHRLRARLDGAGPGSRVIVESAGLRAALGHPAPPLAGEAAARHGTDLALHRSRPITPQQIASSDLILVMTLDQRRRLLIAHPEAAGKILLAARYDPRRVISPEVPDPVFGDAAAFDRVYSRLARIADQLARSLAGTSGSE